MNPPQVYMCSPSWTLLLPPSPSHPSGMIWENGIETCKIPCMKRVASPGSMHDTGCLGLVHSDSFFKTEFNYITLFFLKVFQWLSNTFKVQRSYGTSLVVQWQGLYAPNKGNLGSFPGQRTRSHMLQLKKCMLQLRPSAAK